MRERLSVARAAVIVAAALLLGLLATSPANAVSSWAIYASSGKMSGSFSSNPVNGYWHISGTLKDNVAGDDCTRGQIWVGADLLWSQKLCGASSKSFELQGYTRADHVWVLVCRQGAVRSYCTDREPYLA